VQYKNNIHVYYYYHFINNCLINDIKLYFYYIVNVDEVEDVCAEVGINCMPTFKFYKNGTQVSVDDKTKK